MNYKKRLYEDLIREGLKPLRVTTTYQLDRFTAYIEIQDEFNSVHTFGFEGKTEIEALNECRVNIQLWKEHK